MKDKEKKDKKEKNKKVAEKIYKTFCDEINKGKNNNDLLHTSKKSTFRT